jgi:hypothetical protein
LHPDGGDRLFDCAESRGALTRHLHDAALGVERQLVLATHDRTDRGTKHPNFVLAIQAVDLEA